MLVRLDMTASHSSCRPFGCTSMMKISPFSTFQHRYIGPRPGDYGSPSITIRFKCRSADIKGYKGIIRHTITQPPSWTVDRRQDGYILSCCLHKILNLPPTLKLIRPCNIFQTSVAQFWWNHANSSHSFLFLADKVAPAVVFSCCSPSTSRFDMLYIHVVHSAYLGWNLSYCWLPLRSK